MAALNGMIGPIAHGPHTVIGVSFDTATKRDSEEKGNDAGIVALPMQNGIPTKYWAIGPGDLLLSRKHKVGGAIVGMKRKMHNDRDYNRTTVFANAAGLVVSDGARASYTGTKAEVEAAMIEDTMAEVIFVGVSKGNYNSDARHGTDPQQKGLDVLLRGLATIRVPTPIDIPAFTRVRATIPSRYGPSDATPDLDAIHGREVFTIEPVPEHGATGHAERCLRAYRGRVEAAKSNPAFTPYNIHTGRDAGSRVESRNTALGASYYTGIAGIIAMTIEVLIKKGHMKPTTPGTGSVDPKDVIYWQNNALDILGLGTEVANFAASSDTVAAIIDEALLGETPGHAANFRYRTVGTSGLEILMAALQDSNNESQKIIGTVVGQPPLANPLQSQQGKMRQFNLLVRG